MLVELGVVEQRYRAVLEVLGGATVTSVARRFGVSRGTGCGWTSGLTSLQPRTGHPRLSSATALTFACCGGRSWGIFG